MGEKPPLVYNNSWSLLKSCSTALLFHATGNVCLLVAEESKVLYWAWVAMYVEVIQFRTNIFQGLIWIAE